MPPRMPFNSNFWLDYLSGQEANLPSLPDISILSNRVIRILGGNPGAMHLQGTNTYLIGTGQSRILIDTGQGLPIWLTRLTNLLHSQNLTLSHILLTHWHGDHTGGVPDLISYSPSLGKKVYKNLPDSNQNPISDGQIFSVEGATITAVFTPGHAIDHMCFRLEEENALFTGDNVLGHGYSVSEDLGRYMESLNRMAEVSCAIGYPAHGARIDDLPGKLKEYIRHKEARVKGVLAVLVGKRQAASGSKGGGLRLDEIVRAVFGTVPQEVVDQALTPFLLQVLWKLAEDRKVGFEPGDQVKRRWFATKKAILV